MTGHVFNRMTSCHGLRAKTNWRIIIPDLMRNRFFWKHANVKMCLQILQINLAHLFKGSSLWQFPHWHLYFKPSSDKLCQIFCYLNVQTFDLKVPNWNAKVLVIIMSSSIIILKSDGTIIQCLLSAMPTFYCWYQSIWPKQSGAQRKSRNNRAPSRLQTMCAQLGCRRALLSVKLVVL